LIVRREQAENRRRVLLSLTARGRTVVRRVTDRRRRRIGAIAANLRVEQRAALIDALHAFGEAAGEPSDSAWSLEWLGE